MGLTELSGDLFDVLSDFSGLIHDINEFGTLSTDDEAKLDIIFFLFIFILDEKTDGGRLL
jgi:hypothetical protein